jgi:2-polyprenyl-3-methyl-5-hydroxy-6-metoxy-1,4-benzoquinol methylase
MSAATSKNTAELSAVSITIECFVPGLGNRYLEQLHLKRYDFAVPFAKGKPVLDIACGCGYGSYQLANAGAQSVVGVDIKAENVAHAKDHYRGDNLSFHQGDITTWGLPGSYDLVVCFETIEHISSYQQALSNCRRLLKLGGKLLISSPNRLLSSPRLEFVTGKPENRFHVREFIPSELALLMEAHGFSVCRTGVFGQAFQPKFRSYVLTKAYRKLISRPFASADVQPCFKWRSQPNYFVIVANATEKGSLLDE